MSKVINVAIAGFGMSAQVFHCPFLDLDPHFCLKKVYERSTDKAKQRYPYVEIVREFSQLLSDDIDLVIITTPNLTHYSLAKQAIIAGKHVIVEKPIAVTVAEAEELALLAKQHNVMLSVYQNRRWDNGALTVKHLVETQQLGTIVDYEIRFERYTKSKNTKQWKETGELGVGLVYDLGVHLIDHVVDLFGIPTALYADIRHQHPDVLGEDNFQIYFYYPDKKITMSATKYAREAAPHIILQGTLGSYIKQNVDNQEALLLAGIRPQGDWNKEEEKNWGILHTEQDGVVTRKRFAGRLGNYQAYYDNIYATLTNNAPLAVTVEQAIDVLSLIEKVYQSAALGQKILLKSPQ